MGRMASASEPEIHLRGDDSCNWKGQVWDILCRHQRKDGSPPRFCVHDHIEHIHLIFRCGCPKKCPTRNYRIECTVEQICDIVPRECMHIHENEPVEKPTAKETIASLPRSFCESDSIDEDGCSVCCQRYAKGEQLIELPCGHHFHSACILPWLEKQHTCPTCRFELPSSAGGEKKQSVMLGEVCAYKPSHLASHSHINMPI